MIGVTASSSMIRWFHTLISGRSCRPCAASDRIKSKTSSVKLNEEGGLWASASLLGGEEDDEPWLTSPSRRRKEPPIVGKLPSTLELILGNEIYLEKDGLVPGLRNRLLRLAAFQNPEFYRAQSMRLPTYDKARVIACAQEHPHHIGLPRGCLEDLQDLLSNLNITPVVRDERCQGRALDVTFQGQLRPDQQLAADAMLTHETGVLAATTAFGKTVIAAWLTAQRGVNTLVLVHRRQLLNQ